MTAGVTTPTLTERLREIAALLRTQEPLDAKLRAEFVAAIDEAATDLACD